MNAGCYIFEGLRYEYYDETDEIFLNCHGSLLLSMLPDYTIDETRLQMGYDGKLLR